MSEQEDQSILMQRIWRMQIANARAHQGLLHFALLGLVLITFSFYQQFSLVDSNQLAGWTVAAISLIAVSAVLSNHINSRQHRISTEIIDIYLLVNTFVFGIIMAFGQVIFHANVAPFSTQNTLDISVNLFGFAILFSHMVGLICYTDRYRYFCTFVLTSMSPLIAQQLVRGSETLIKPNSILIDIYILFILFCGYRLHKIRTKSAWLVIRNENLIDYMESSKDHTELVNAQLEQEMRQRIYTEEKLQESNTRLEEKVRERTQDLTNSNTQLQSSQQRLEMAHSAGGIGTWDWDIAHRKMHSTNFEQILGYSDEEMESFLSDMAKIVHVEDYPIVRQAVAAHLLNHTDRYEAEFRMRHKYGYWVWIQDIGRVVERDPQTRFAKRMVGVRRNINAERLAAEGQKLSSTVFQQVAEGIFILDGKMRYINMNPFFEKITGFSRDELIGNGFLNLNRIFTTRAQQSQQKIIKTLETIGEFEGEAIGQHKNGDEFPMWMHINSIVDEKQRKTHYVGIISDLTERKKNEQRLSYLANYDLLTDLPNRNFFKDHLHQLILQSTDDDSSFALLRLNLDRFRLLNDLLGAEGADQLLKQVAQRLSSYDARTGIIAHLGGDDFAIVLPHTEENQKELEQYCEKLLEVFETPFDIKAQEITVTISVGIAIFPEHGRQVDTISNYAENALQEAKRVGGNTIRFASKQLGIQSLERINLENALRKALSSEQFVVYYQAKFNAATQTIVGFEALVRWNHPTKGLIAPIQFIGLAEEMGIISALGEFVLDQSCAQIKKWQESGFDSLTVSVNVSAQQLQRGNFIATIDRILKKHQIDPSLLELEITETLLMDEPEKVRGILQEIKTRNISIALDDFGTGYSSLSYLGLYPIDVIKVDRSFVMHMTSNHEQRAIVRAILAMSHSLNMKVVAEGVETIEQAQLLRAEGCDLLQGFLLSKPLPAFEATLLLINAMSTPLITI
ncbi:putative bifunctional diguanylate cyclase/phosphodiesterase [Aquirhabdus parva]|uniref:cyclic-guanylate-specific phosphodiesterase n=1 Tax=Aquirhabdus parva TaxID=2283318 RepID=A0A345P6V4_9GAMM|nr:EAL domain-containing protein [Aquirhabdus parva]AXI03013.1 EAL domain-containing protein [Aquirhabdus parva]